MAWIDQAQDRDKCRAVVNTMYGTAELLSACIKRNQLDVTCFFISLFNAQHVSDVNTSILRSLRLVC